MKNHIVITADMFYAGEHKGIEKRSMVNAMTTTKHTANDVYNQIKAMILDFRLYPGSRITEHELADMFSVSRTPIRAALQKLEAEAYLSVKPKQGCYVRNVDIELLTHYYQVRIDLELMSLRLACTYMSDADLQALATAWNPELQSGRSENADEMEALDESFHITLAEGGRNQALLHYLKDINSNIRIIRRLDFTDQQRVDLTYEEHYLICQDLIKRDVVSAETKMRSHIQKSENFARTLTLTQLAKARPKSQQQ